MPERRQCDLSRFEKRLCTEPPQTFMCIILLSALSAFYFFFFIIICVLWRTDTALVPIVACVCDSNPKKTLKKLPRNVYE